jgi:hypothetical protein
VVFPVLLQQENQLKKFKFGLETVSCGCSKNCCRESLAAVIFSAFWIALHSVWPNLKLAEK